MTMLQYFDGLIRPLFIETGTGEGNTLYHASQVFERCISIEQNEKAYLLAKERFKDTPTIELHHGHSPLILPRILDPQVPTTFWLDAHYHGQGVTLCPDGGECPLAAELRAIMRAPWNTPPLVAIDDSFMFDDSIPHPGSKYPFWFSNESGHDIYHRNQWPRIEELDAILEGYERSQLGREIAFLYKWKG
jgi:hypothetical protein